MKRFLAICFIEGVCLAVLSQSKYWLVIIIGVYVLGLMYFSLVKWNITTGITAIQKDLGIKTSYRKSMNDIKKEVYELKKLNVTNAEKFDENIEHIGVFQMSAIIGFILVMIKFSFL